MARVILKDIEKVFPGDVVAVKDFNLEVKDKEFGGIGSFDRSCFKRIKKEGDEMSTPSKIGVMIGFLAMGLTFVASYATAIPARIEITQDKNGDGTGDKVKVKTSVYIAEIDTTEYMGYISHLGLVKGKSGNLLKPEWLGIHELPYGAGGRWYWNIPINWGSPRQIGGKEIYPDIAFYKDAEMKEVAVPIYHSEYAGVNLIKNPQKMSLKKEKNEVTLEAQINQYLKRIWRLKFYEDRIEVNTRWIPSQRLYLGCNMVQSAGHHLFINIPGISLPDEDKDYEISFIKRGENVYSVGMSQWQENKYPEFEGLRLMRETRGRYLDGFTLINTITDEGLTLLYDYKQPGKVEPIYPKNIMWYWDAELSGTGSILYTPRQKYRWYDPDATLAHLETEQRIEREVKGVKVKGFITTLPEEGIGYRYPEKCVGYTYHIIPSSPKLERIIQGRITRRGKPVPGANIDLWQEIDLRGQTKTDQEGRYKLISFYNGEYELRVTAPGYKPESRSLQVKGKRATADFKLSQETELPWLHADGRYIKDEAGNIVHLYGIQGAGNFDVSPLKKEDERRELAAKSYEITIRAAARMGHNHLRLVFGMGKDFPGEFFEYVLDPAIERSRAEGVYLILDCHDGGPANGADIKYFVKNWGIIAKRYKDEPVIAAYEILNEPGGGTYSPEFLKKLYDETIAEIRKYDKKHMIVFGAGWGRCDLTVWLKIGLPVDPQQNLVFTPHHYPEPWTPSDGGVRKKLRIVYEISSKYNIPIWLGEWADGRIGQRDRFVRDWVYFMRQLHWHYNLWVRGGGFEEWNPPEAIRFWFHSPFGPYILSTNFRTEHECYHPETKSYVCKLSDKFSPYNIRIKIPTKVFPENEFTVYSDAKDFHHQYDPGTRILTVEAGGGTTFNIIPKTKRVSSLYIRDIIAAKVPDGLKISWETDQSATSLIEYSTEYDFKKYGLFFDREEAGEKFSKKHSVTLKDIKGSFYYLIKSRTPQGVWALSDAKYFHDKEAEKRVEEGYPLHPGTGITRDGEGNFWVASSQTNEVLKISPQGETLKKLTSLNSPTDVLVARDGKVWISDTDNHRVGIFTLNGELVKWIDSFPGEQFKLPSYAFMYRGDEDKLWGGEKFKNPAYLAEDKQGNVWVSDRFNLRVVKFTRDGEYAGEAHIIPSHPWGSYSTGVMGIDFGPQGNLYVAVHDSVYKMNPDTGEHLRGWAIKGKITAHQTKDLAVDKRGYIYCAEGNDYRLEIFSPEGNQIRQIVSFPKVGVGSPWGIWKEGDKIYIIFSDNPQVLALDTTELALGERKLAEEEEVIKGENILPNASFEIGDGEGLALHWKRCFAGYNLEESVVRKGKHSIKLGGDRNKYFGAESDLIPVEKGKRYMIKGWVKTVDAAGDSYLKVSLYDPRGMWGTGTGCSKKVSGTGDWQSLQITFKSHKKGTIQIICCSDNNSGYTYFDDVEVVEER